MYLDFKIIYSHFSTFEKSDEKCCMIDQLSIISTGNIFAQFFIKTRFFLNINESARILIFKNRPKEVIEYNMFYLIFTRDLINKIGYNEKVRKINLIY